MAMSSRELVQAGSRPTPPLTSERAVAPAARTPVPTGVQNPVIDQTVKPTTHEVDHAATVHPVSQRPQVLHPRGHMMTGEGGRHFFSSDDSALSRQIQDTHAPESQELDVKPVLSIVEDILRLARPLTDEHTVGATTTAVVPGTQTPAAHVDHKPVDTVRHLSYHDDRLYQNSSYLDSEIVKVLAYPINKVSSEIICKSSAGGESHQVTMDILKSLSSFSWDAKLVIAFAGFAIHYGEFWLVEQHHTKEPLAKNIATLKDLPEIMAHSSELRKQFEDVLKLLNEILKVTHCIIEFKELPPLYISKQSPEITAATAHIPTAVYWSIRGLLVCAATLLSLIGGGHEYITSTSMSWEILNLTHKLSVILDHLGTQMDNCRKLVGRKKEEDAYRKFKQLLSTAHIDNMKVLTALFRPREDQRPIYDGTRRANERLEVLRLKYVLLLISDLELPPEELHVLHLIHHEHTMRKEYEILWLPIVDPMITMTQDQDPKFHGLRENMPWFSGDHPSVVEPVAIRYIREELRFTHMPMLVVLDPHGRISNHDALPMMWIWGAKAFPFTKDWERRLWDESQWNIDLIADNIDPRTSEWISANRVICLYGGDNIEWIRKFTTATRTAARALNVPLEMLYVGKRNPREKVRLCHEVIAREGLSHIFSTDYYDYVWFFWVRLASMWNSKTQMGRNVDDDHIMKGILDLLTFDSSEQGWAIFSRGNYEITMAIGEKVLPVVERYTDWAYEVDQPEKFVTVLSNHLRDFHPAHHCHSLILPGQAGYIPERVVCSECHKPMDKYVMYRCCDD